MLAAFWDERVARGDFVRALRYWRDITAADGHTWSKVAGPFVASFLTLRRVGACWAKPFELVLSFGSVDVLATPPKQVVALLVKQARISLDVELVEKCIADVGSDAWRDEVRGSYRHGIDWPAIRRVLRCDLVREPRVRGALIAAVR